MNRALQILGTRRVFHREHGFTDQLAGHRPNDVDTQDLVAVARSDNFCETRARFHRARPSARCKRKAADLIGHAACLDLLLALPDPGNLRCGVDDGRDHVIVDLGVAPADQVRDHQALFLALVREHRAAHHIAHRPDMRHGRAAVLIDDDKATLVDFDARTLREQPLRIGTTSDCNDHLVELQLLLALCIDVREVDRTVLDRCLLHLGAKTDIEPEFLEVPLRFARNGLIGNWQELLKCLEHHDLTAKPAPYAAQL